MVWDEFEEREETIVDKWDYEDYYEGVKVSHCEELICGGFEVTLVVGLGVRKESVADHWDYQ